ncbi:MAG: glycosyltransferase family 4 protein [Lachnospiraceae bacterium]|nr:glycosyltransferase family 4 protein [Lachnospiraceae bacterium]
MIDSFKKIIYNALIESEIKMRVLIINPILFTAENDDIPQVFSIKDTMIYSLCMAFLECGHEPVLVAASAYRPLLEEDYPFEVKWMKCICKKIFKPRYLPLLKGLGRYLRKSKRDFDYIISSEVFSLTSLQCVIWAKSKLIIWHELGAHQKLLKQIPSKLWYNCVARLFMRFVLVVPRSKRASEFISVYCQNVADTFIDHGVDLKKIGFSKEKEEYFVVVSQLIKRKNILNIIHIFHDFIKESDMTYQLRIIGEGELKEELQEEAVRLGLKNNVIFYGKMNHQEMLPILQKAKALLIDTQKDNSMVSIVESIAAGTPILTNSVPFNADYIKRENLGIVKDNWSTTELKMICDKNAVYVKNCLIYRDKLSAEYNVKQFNLLNDQKRNNSK